MNQDIKIKLAQTEIKDINEFESFLTKNEVEYLEIPCLRKIWKKEFGAAIRNYHCDEDYPLYEFFEEFIAESALKTSEGLSEEDQIWIIKETPRSFLHLLNFYCSEEPSCGIEVREFPISKNALNLLKRKFRDKFNKNYRDVMVSKIEDLAAEGRVVIV